MPATTRPTAPDVTPEELESSGVVFLDRLDHALAAIGARRMLYARLNWDAFIQSAYPPGALPAKLAKALLTKRARAREAARKELMRQKRVDDFRTLLAAARRRSAA